jgi:phytoene desaturase
MKKVVVIGAGIAGLAAAVRLACAGYKVTVIEANTYPGGKLSAFEKGGYRFDAGPSLFTLPQLVTELFTLAGKKSEDYFQYLQLEKACTYFYEDGTLFTAYHNREQFAEELKQKLGLQDATPLFSQLDKAAFRYKITAPLFVEQSLHRIQNFINLKTLKGIWNVFKLNLFTSMHHENDQLFTDKRLVQYFNRFATYNGSNPYMAPALLNMIPHLEHNIGTFFPKGGMHQITESIYQLACELGVTFRFGQPVDEIVTQGNKVTGVRVSDEIVDASIVVSNADIHATYRKLLPKHTHPEKLLNQEKSSSALIFYWGINHTFDELGLHNILFSADYKTEFEHIFKQHTIYEDPTIYINITSKHKPDDAPAGGENWFVMINVPNNRGQNWDELITAARKQVIAKINKLLHTDIEPMIAVEELLEPRTIESKTSSYAGALYGNASNNRYAAFLRHKNFSSSINGLYCCGGSVHPGGGIPLCLNSAKIVASLVAEREG